MNLDELKENWEGFAEDDPMWAILTEPNKKSNKWEKAEFFATGKNEINKQLAIISDELKVDLALDHALDFGCGMGRCSNGLAHHFEKVTGVDISSVMIEKAKKNAVFPEKTHYQVNVVDHLKVFQDNTFTMVFSVIVLQHIHPKYAKKFIAEFLRVLRKDGILLFQVHTSRRYKSIVDYIKSLVPQSIKNNIYARLNKDKYVMELHHIPVKKIEEIIVNGKGRILKRKDVNIPNGYTTSWFYIKKL